MLSKALRGAAPTGQTESITSVPMPLPPPSHYLPRSVIYRAERCRARACGHEAGMDDQWISCACSRGADRGRSRDQQQPQRRARVSSINSVGSCRFLLGGCLVFVPSLLFLDRAVCLAPEDDCPCGHSSELVRGCNQTLALTWCTKRCEL